MLSQVTFLVDLKSLSSGKRVAVRWMWWVLWVIVSIRQLAHFIRVIFSPYFISFASSHSNNTYSLLNYTLSPREGFYWWRGTVIVVASSPDTQLVMSRIHCLVDVIAEYLPALLSITFLFIAHNLSHSIILVFLEGPCSNMNSARVYTVSPLLRMPLKVGKRGSFHPSTLLVSTNQLSFLLLKQVC